ncbi:hypothetical protein V6N11_080187 [Hibiscus sabdariffa]|uniref:Uncharacterized protein n=1 Tax=Hibiscus sabdariffa TaxID=183260 RepID=A0ABR1ZXK9_9ROSI
MIRGVASLASRKSDRRCAHLVYRFASALGSFSSTPRSPHASGKSDRRRAHLVYRFASALGSFSSTPRSSHASGAPFNTKTLSRCKSYDSNSQRELKRPSLVLNWCLFCNQKTNS